LRIPFDKSADPVALVAGEENIGEHGGIDFTTIAGLAA
jgi:hypothetical protein